MSKLLINILSLFLLLVLSSCSKSEYKVQNLSNDIQLLKLSRSTTIIVIHGKPFFFDTYNKELINTQAIDNINQLKDLCNE